MSNDQRGAPRTPIRLEVKYKRLNTFFSDYTRNISRGGTFICTSNPLPKGTRFQFALHVPGQPDPLTLDGTVMWVNRGNRPGEPGMGIRFVFETKQAKEQIRQQVEALMRASLGPELSKKLLDG